MMTTTLELEQRLLVVALGFGLPTKGKSNVGAYRLTVPAGTFDAALLRWDFKSKIGPATVEDIQARFVAPGVGMVAAAEKGDIASILDLQPALTVSGQAPSQSDLRNRWAWRAPGQS